MFNRSYINGHQLHPHYFNNSKIRSLAKSTNLQAGEDFARVIKNLSDKTKLKIYYLLGQVEEMPVSDIKEILGISQSAVSHALSDLKKIDLIKSTRCGKLICYSLNNRKKKKIDLFLKSIGINI